MDLSELRETLPSEEPEVDICALHWRETSDDHKDRIIADQLVLQEWLRGKPISVIGIAADNDDGTKIVITEDEDGLVQYELMDKDGHLGAVRE